MHPRRLLPLVALVLVVLAALTAAAGAGAAPIAPRVINGGPAGAGTWPAYTQLTIAKPNGVYLCGGALISPTVVLTAAHCVVGALPGASTAVIGSTSCTGGTAVRWADARANPDYSATTLVGDVAVVRLAAPSSSTPLPLVAPGGTPDTPATVRVAGCGLVQQSPDRLATALQTAAIPLVADADCAAAYPGGPASERFDTATMLCAGGETVDTCSGDSGGPLTASIAGVQTLIGDVSWGPSPCAQSGAPGVYGRIEAFLPWIAAQLAYPHATSVTNTGRTVTLRWAHDDPSPAHQPIDAWTATIAGARVALDPAVPAVSAAVAADGAISIVLRARSGTAIASTYWTGIPTATRAPHDAAVQVTGTAQLGSKLTASATSDDPWAQVAYRWRADGVAIRGATGRTYRPTRSTAGKALTVTATFSHGAYAATARSAPTARVTSPPLASATLVRTRGSPVVGGLVYVIAPRVSAFPRARISYRWLRDGRPIGRATRAAYWPRLADRGHRIACRITFVNALGSARAASRAVRVR